MGNFGVVVVSGRSAGSDLRRSIFLGAATQPVSPVDRLVAAVSLTASVCI